MRACLVIFLILLSIGVKAQEGGSELRVEPEGIILETDPEFFTKGGKNPIRFYIDIRWQKPKLPRDLDDLRGKVFQIRNRRKALVCDMEIHPGVKDRSGKNVLGLEGKAVVDTKGAKGMVFKAKLSNRHGWMSWTEEALVEIDTRPIDQRIQEVTFETVSPDTSNVGKRDYAALQRLCKTDSCCLASITNMREGNGYLLKDLAEECESGYTFSMLKCVSSYRWCEPAR